MRYMREKLDQLAPATAQKNINLQVLSRVAVSLPPEDEIERIVDEVERLKSVIDTVEREVGRNLARASRLRQSILKRAFEGKLVPQDLNDGPASQVEREKPAQRSLPRVPARRVATR